jgi:hypothetical protein
VEISFIFGGMIQIYLLYAVESRIYQETLRQVMAGEADHLDDLTYDLVTL